MEGDGENDDDANIKPMFVCCILFILGVGDADVWVVTKINDINNKIVKMDPIMQKP